MTPAPYSEQDLVLVVHAGDWREVVDATEEERALAGACAGLEAELRERAWSAFEQLRPYLVDGRVEPPDAEPERIRVLAAVVELGWHFQAPEGWQPAPPAPRALQPEEGERRLREAAEAEARPWPSWPAIEEFAALEVYLAHATADDLHLPDDDDEAAELADAIVMLGWLRPGPLEAS